ncbi:3-hydroxyacyl-CoA dehydrogenase family protein [Saccharothrix sp. 6-C]|uniref:3-hydroxybutyryl-CoA dehydrogenase n=1 Tax=Saccharothrix texasensis TaxID=103734 RepID=A0A3N1H2F3_9PSEU|nr:MULTISPECIES: 3-hydroxyacyl-CoA dehydrogenase family protein [Saccharothrix]QQQ78724.1 3-hydroxyacyl-CoA dehydrogenase family protein [Saccharothrix sp. 6-C]ROP36586.1 3-hydroxybutyryl-CoA dehydrogenase [Saccharothrix texasensis]
MTDRVAVLGLGVMGAGIAHVVAASGRDVVALEIDADRVVEGSARLRAFLDGGVARGKTTAEERDAVLARVRPVVDVAELAGVALVIEAVTERADVKGELLGRVAAVVPDDALIATNTSALAVTDLAASVPHPERFGGLHFFNPAPLMKVVEVVPGLRTAPETVTALVEFATGLGKDAVVVGDRPGFLVNHLLIPYLNDVVAEYDRDLADAADLDTAMRLGLGYRLGPLELLDLIGLDVHEHAARRAYEATHDPAFAPPPLLTRMVAAGYLGAKSGRGFRTGGENAG